MESHTGSSTPLCLETRVRKGLVGQVPVPFRTSKAVNTNWAMAAFYYQHFKWFKQSKGLIEEGTVWHRRSEEELI